MAVPRVIIFDLDGTLWNPEMYQLWGGGSPFKRNPKDNSSMIDRSGESVRLIGETREVLEQLANNEKWSSTYLAISSTCDEPAWAMELLRLFQFTRAGKIVEMGALFGNLVEIYKSNKAQQHRKILEKVRVDDPTIEFSDMLFFDNQRDNIRNVEPLGVTCCYCGDGMTPGTFERGIALWRKNSSSL